MYTCTHGYIVFWDSEWQPPRPLIKTCPMAQETFFESSWPRKQPPKQRPRSKPPLGESSQKLAVPQFPDSVHALDWRMHSNSLKLWDCPLPTSRQQNLSDSAWWCQRCIYSSDYKICFYTLGMGGATSDVGIPCSPTMMTQPQAQDAEAKETQARRFCSFVVLSSGLHYMLQVHVNVRNCNNIHI